MYYYYRRPSIETAIAVPAALAVGNLFGAAFAALAEQREQNARLAQEWNAYNRAIARRQEIRDSVDREIDDIYLRDIARQAEYRLERRRLGLG
jgi:hypothetical protein